MSRNRSLSLFVLPLILALPLAAAGPADPAATNPSQTAQADASPLCATSSLSIAPPVWMLPHPTPQSTCIVQCWDGSTRTCEGSTCTAYDSACPDEQGRCFASGETVVYKKCPPCPSTPPCPDPACEDLDGTYCKYNGSTTTCYYESSVCRELTCTCSASGGSGSWICP
jgi:hypothetical protein